MEKLFKNISNHNKYKCMYFDLKIVDVFDR